MRGSPARVIDRLDDEWHALLQRGGLDVAVQSWRRIEPALDFASVDGLLESLDPDAHPSGGRRDQVLTALLRVARTDALARRLLIQRFVPSLKRLAADTPTPLDRDEWVSLVVSTAYEVIATYPLDARPRRIAANIACDIRKRVHAALRERRREHAELVVDTCELALWPDRDPSPRPGGHLGAWVADASDRDLAEVEVEDLLAWAVAERLLDEPTAALLALTRIHGVTLGWVAPQLRTAADTLGKRRRRAERRIAAALTAEAS